MLPARLRASLLFAILTCLVCIGLYLHPSISSSSIGPSTRHVSPPEEALRTLNLLTPRANDLDSSDANWLGFPVSELSSRTNAELGPKGKLALVGKKMLCLMSAPASSPLVPQSIYQSPSAMLEHGYHNFQSVGTFELSAKREVEYFSSELAIHTEKEFWIKNSANHNQRSQWPQTGALFENLVNIREGVLIAEMNFGPDNENEENDLGLRPDQIVPLKRWSDVAGLQWIASVAAERPMGLITGVTDPEELGEFPGKSYPITSAQGLAALGTAHGKGVAWLLAQHKAAFGVLTIDHVNFYNCVGLRNFPQWCIYYHVVEAQQPGNDN
ncbi:hypothetical protein Slin15195_G126520 [Septoria linicola]|uniref:Uncharacterized protein n=1 Tax=Septoria linicola TaxID=215465 RepID=A0A9Q9B5H1_9PEZI|nr:hypothetical protein Slin15195_G126520 [Septoria linicola]